MLGFSSYFLSNLKSFSHVVLLYWPEKGTWTSWYASFSAYVCVRDGGRYVLKKRQKSVMNFFTVQKFHKFETHPCNLLRVFDFWLSGVFLCTLSLVIKEEPLREDFRSRALRKFSSLTHILRLLFFIFVYKWHSDGGVTDKGIHSFISDSNKSVRLDMSETSFAFSQRKR